MKLLQIPPTPQSSLPSASPQQCLHQSTASIGCLLGSSVLVFNSGLYLSRAPDPWGPSWPSFLKVELYFSFVDPTAASTSTCHTININVCGLTHCSVAIHLPLTRAAYHLFPSRTGVFSPCPCRSSQQGLLILKDGRLLPQKRSLKVWDLPSPLKTGRPQQCLVPLMKFFNKGKFLCVITDLQ